MIMFLFSDGLLVHDSPSAAFFSLTMAMGRGIRVFHNPNQTPYSVLIEQRGVDHCILLESQAILTLSKYLFNIRNK